MYLLIDADPSILCVLQALGIKTEWAVPSNGQPGRVRVRWTEEVDKTVLNVLDRLVDARWAYIDHCQRAHGIQLRLPALLEEARP